MSSTAARINDTMIRLVIVGDIHDQWDRTRDAEALKFLQPDAAIFVGDFGNEATSIVADIAAIDLPKAAILGNHDGWGPLYFFRNQNKVQQQLQSLGGDHVGYGHKQFKAASGQPFSVVGGRPFTDGNASLDTLTSQLFDIANMRDSSQRIADCILSQPAQQPVIVVGHNGPAGLGAAAHDICGKDFVREAGDYGDRDLREAISTASAQGRTPALVTFGHMHQALYGSMGARLRNMAHIDASDAATGVVFLNAAVVPRRKQLDGRGFASHFLVVTLLEGLVAEADNVWVGGSPEQGFSVAQKEGLLKSHVNVKGELVGSVYRAFHKDWRETVIATQPGAVENMSADQTAREL